MLTSASTFSHQHTNTQANYDFSASDVQKVLGENMLRVMEAVEDRAYNLQNPGSKQRKSSSSSSTWDGDRSQGAATSGQRRNDTNDTNGSSPIDFPGGASEAYLRYEALEPYLNVLSDAVLEDGELPPGTPSYAPGGVTCRPTTFKVGGVDSAASAASSRRGQGIPDEFGPFLNHPP
jgi:hypothetical protein